MIGYDIINNKGNRKLLICTFLLLYKIWEQFCCKNKLFLFAQHRLVLVDADCFQYTEMKWSSGSFDDGERILCVFSATFLIFSCRSATIQLPFCVSLSVCLSFRLSRAITRNRKGLESWKLVQIFFIWLSRGTFHDFSKFTFLIPLGVKNAEVWPKISFKWFFGIEGLESWKLVKILFKWLSRGTFHDF